MSLPASKQPQMTSYLSYTDAKLCWGQSEPSPSTSLKPELGPEPSPPPSTTKVHHLQLLPGPARTWLWPQRSWIPCSRPPAGEEFTLVAAELLDTFPTSGKEFTLAVGRGFYLKPKLFEGSRQRNAIELPTAGIASSPARALSRL
jgi:hypothetical protein